MLETRWAKIGPWVNTTITLAYPGEFALSFSYSLLYSPAVLAISQISYAGMCDDSKTVTTTKTRDPRPCVQIVAQCPLTSLLLLRLLNCNAADVRLYVEHARGRVALTMVLPTLAANELIVSLQEVTTIAYPNHRMCSVASIIGFPGALKPWLVPACLIVERTDRGRGPLTSRVDVTLYVQDTTSSSSSLASTARLDDQRPHKETLSLMSNMMSATLSSTLTNTTPSAKDDPEDATADLRSLPSTLLAPSLSEFRIH